jgi:hypothetical protein
MGLKNVRRSNGLTPVYGLVPEKRAGWPENRPLARLRGRP